MKNSHPCTKRTAYTNYRFYRSSVNILPIVTYIKHPLYRSCTLMIATLNRSRSFHACHLFLNSLVEINFDLNMLFSWRADGYWLKWSFFARPQSCPPLSWSCISIFLISRFICPYFALGIFKNPLQSDDFESSVKFLRNREKNML